MFGAVALWLVAVVAAVLIGRRRKPTQTRPVREWFRVSFDQEKVLLDSYAIPLDANGGDELLKELVRRGLMPAELVIEAMGSTDGVFCHPPEP
jgi:hypothetical protein